VNAAMLKFEFITEMGACYLDNVSIKKKYENTKQLIANGRFETGTLGYYCEYCHTIHSWFGGFLSNTTVCSGTYSFASADFGPGSRKYLTQIIPIEKGTDYVIEFYLLYVGNVVSAKISIDSH
jgi:hypothetical protein